MNFVSLFTGIGGFDIGFERAGMTCTAQVEWDKYATQVLERHWPNVPRFGDINEVNTNDIGQPDVLCGGFPCQDISQAGQQAGIAAGTRSGEWHQFARLIVECQPAVVVIENVAALLWSNNGDDMQTVIGHLESCGYQWAYRLLDSQYFGVAQRRRRVFIVASRRGERHPSEVLFESEGVRRDSPPSRETTPAVAALTAHGVGTCGADDNQAQAGHLIPDIANTLEPSPRVRKLMPLECERLQGFDDGWTDNLTDTRRYRALGNAVTVNVAEWLGHRIMGAA